MEFLNMVNTISFSSMFFHEKTKKKLVNGFLFFCYSFGNQGEGLLQTSITGFVENKKLTLMVIFLDETKDKYRLTGLRKLDEQP